MGMPKMQGDLQIPRIGLISFWGFAFRCFQSMRDVWSSLLRCKWKKRPPRFSHADIQKLLPPLCDKWLRLLLPVQPWPQNALILVPLLKDAKNLYLWVLQLARGAQKPCRWYKTRDCVNLKIQIPVNRAKWAQIYSDVQKIQLCDAPRQ